MPDQSKIDLAKQADELLRRANCDALTGAKKNRRYRLNERAKNRKLGPHRREREKKLGKFGATSPVR
jgi:hypothetical protein